MLETDYVMTREEALKKVRQMSLPKETMEILKALAPELKESEDERIRKELIEKIRNLACGCFISQEQKQRFIHYLEKQKEQKPGEIPPYVTGIKGEPDPAGVWKPSEEHLSALLAVFNDPNNIGSQTCQLALTDLYEQLKKL